MAIQFGRVDDRRLAAIASAAADAPFSYAEVGETAGHLPSGYRHDRYHVDLGSHPDAFTRACEGLRRWEAHRRAGARVAPVDAPLEVGTTVAIAVDVSFATVIAPCRIVYVSDDLQRFGYAYGTLRGHPERGEAAFHVVSSPEGTRFEIVSFSRPVHPLARIGRPLGRRVQRAVTRRYLEALRAFVAEG